MRTEARVNGVVLTAEVIPMGDDLCVAVTGGDRPHLGSVALAVPHPGITDPDLPSATVSTLNLPAHRDDALANGWLRHSVRRWDSQWRSYAASILTTIYLSWRRTQNRSRRSCAISFCGRWSRSRTAEPGLLPVCRE